VEPIEEPSKEPVVEPLEEPAAEPLDEPPKEHESINEIIPYIKNIIGKVRDKINSISLEIEKKSSVKNEKIQEIIKKINVSETEYNEIKKRFYSKSKKKVKYDLN